MRGPEWVYITCNVLCIEVERKLLLRNTDGGRGEKLIQGGEKFIPVAGFSVQVKNYEINFDNVFIIKVLVEERRRVGCQRN